LLPTQLRAEVFVEEAMRWLPDSAATEPVLEREILSPLLETTSSHQRPFVLVADDNADMREYMRRLLSLSYEVEAVADGNAALEVAHRRRPELILTDVMMPRLDGYGLLRAVRADPELSNVPMILLSAHAGEEASIEGLEAGADDYLIKPFSARELMARVGASLSLARGRRQAAEELRRLNDTLEQRVAEEIAERMKAEEAFRQAQKWKRSGN
jgi:DNA-binding response OmpR family regulator